MKVLVTGHRGFIGQQVFSELERAGFQVRGYDIDDKFPQEKFQGIVHLGARTLIRKSIEKPYEYFDDNLGLAMRFLEKARIDNSTFIFPTSGSVMEPTNPYSLSKRQITEWINLYGKLYNLKFHILKFYNVYGPTSRKGAVYLFTNASLRGEEAVVYGDGTHRRDFIHVRDVSKIIINTISGKYQEAELEVGTGVGTSVNDLIKIVEAETSRQVKFHREPCLVDEAEALYARKPLLDRFITLREGVKEVAENLRKSGGK